MKEKLETQMAMETGGGRQGLAVWYCTLDRMTGPQRAEKAFELTETARQVMRDGIRHQNPDASEEQLHKIYLDRLLSFHGLTLEEIRQRQNRDLGR